MWKAMKGNVGGHKRQCGRPLKAMWGATKGNVGGHARRYVSSRDIACVAVNRYHHKAMCCVTHSC